MTFLIGIASIAGTILVYLLSRKVNKRFPNPFTIPVLTGTLILVAGLYIFRIPYETYNEGAKWINELLGPAVVALAYPLYKQWGMLKKNAVPILTGVCIGALIGVSSGLFFSKWVGIDEQIMYSLIPKSVTTPVAMDITLSIGGVPALAAVFVMFAGISGAIMSTYVYRLFNIHHYLAKGLGVGSASHAIGIAMAMEHSEEEGAAGTVAMGLSSIVVSLITHPLIWLII